MHRSLALMLLLALITVPLHAADKASKKRTADEEKKINETRKLIAEKGVDLNGSSWELTLGSSDPKIKGAKDVFVFQDGMFKSENLAKRGFAPTNYTISIPVGEEDRAVWETMQTNKDDLVFIRGEWAKDSMTGHVTEQLEGGKKVKEYSFSSAPRKRIPPSSKEEKTAEGTAIAVGPEGSNAALVSIELGKPTEKDR